MSTTRSSVRCAVTSSGDSTGQSHAEANTALLISSASAVQSLRTANAGILRRLFAKLRGGQDSASQSADPVSVSTTPPTSVLAKPEPLSTAPPTSAPPAEPESVPITAHSSAPSEVDSDLDDVEALLRRAIEMVRSPMRGSQPTRSGMDGPPRTPTELAGSMRAKKLPTNRVVQIRHDPHKATYVAKDTKAGLVIMRHQESERLRELCEWIGWGVIDGRVPSAND